MANHTDFDEPHKTLISKSMTYNNWVHIGQVISIAKYNSNLFYVESFTQKAQTRGSMEKRDNHATTN
jgi:hypothetical protein